MKTTPYKRWHGFCPAIASVLTVAAMLGLSLLPGCAGLTSDLASPSGQALQADLFSDVTAATAVYIGKGTDISADLAAGNAFANTYEAYSTLPTTTAQMASLSAAAASTSAAFQSAAPKIAALVETYTKKGLSSTTAKQTAASAVYGVSGLQNAVSAVQQVAAIGNP